MLSPQQVRHYRTFGFVLLPQLLTQDEVRTLRHEYEEALGGAYSGADVTDPGVRRWSMALSQPLFSHLPEDPRFYGAAEQLWGSDCFCLAAGVNRMPGTATPWHSDHKDPAGRDDVLGAHFAIYLDDGLGPESGALRIIPGSHRDPLHSALRDELAAAAALGGGGSGSPGTAPMLFGLPPTDVPAVTFVPQVPAGDVALLDLRVWHAAFGGKAGRRFCSVVFYRRPPDTENAAAARRLAKAHREINTSMGTKAGWPVYDPQWLQNLGPTASERRGRWIRQLREFGFIPQQDLEAAKL